MAGAEALVARLAADARRAGADRRDAEAEADSWRWEARSRLSLSLLLFFLLPGCTAMTIYRLAWRKNI